MPSLKPMPPITIPPAELAAFGTKWLANGQKLSRTPPYSSGELGKLFDKAVGDALAAMLDKIPIVIPKAKSIAPTEDCVEVGPVRIVGGVRSQNFDVGYRPDGVRFVFEVKP